MFKIVATAAVFTLTAAAAPVLADDAKPHQFAETVAAALGYLTITNDGARDAVPFTRDAQLGDGAFGPHATLRNTAKSSRAQVFQEDTAAASRDVEGYRGFGLGHFGRIDR